MLRDDKPATIDDAELLGWTGLDVDCGACRTLTVLAWADIARRTRLRQLGDIRDGLVCRRCGRKPERVCLYMAPHAPANGTSLSRREAI